MTKTLPPYNPGARCPKCGFSQVSTTYQRPRRDTTPWECHARRAHLDRRCGRCGYAWCEATLPRRPKVTDPETEEK